MWNRGEIKTEAKRCLGKNYLGPFLICLLITFLSGDLIQESTIESGMKLSFSILNIRLPLNYGLHMSLFYLLWFMLFVFVVNPLYVGNARYFIKHMDGEVSMKEAFLVFKDPYYLNIVKVMLLMEIKVVLWTLCLILPGIYKSIQYSMIPYLLAENSECNTSDYFDATKKITNNEIWHIFVLGLSFFGWYILGAIVIVGGIFVDPYYEATFVQLYQRLVRKLE